MLKNGKPFGKDYFDELLERIREIRASERRAYQKITDIFEQCSYDYDKNSEITKNFYAFVQNKLHFAVTGKTAAELIYERADSEKPAMGLTTWKDAPDGKVLKRDIGIAKNYLNEKELSRLNRLVTMFIDYAELMAEDEILMSMQDWVEQTNQFLLNNRREVLDGKGKISHEAAMKKVEKEYEESASYENESAYFEYFSASQVLKDYDLSDDEIESGIVGAGNDGGCDGMYIFLNKNIVLPDQMETITASKESKVEVIIIQAKRENSFGENAIMKWKTTAENLLQLSNSIRRF